jgi:hypothetical protein
MNDRHINIPGFRIALFLRSQFFDDFIRTGIPGAGANHLDFYAGMRRFKFRSQPGFHVIHHILIACCGYVQDGIGLCAVAQK